MTNINADQIASHFENYDGPGKLTQGFVSWCWHTRKETLEALMSGDTEQLASDIAYSAEEGAKMQEDYDGERCTDADAQMFITMAREDLIAAITESLND